MKLKQFLKALGATDGWEIVDGRLRHKCDGGCPLAVVCETVTGIRFGIAEPEKAAKVLDIEYLTTAIILAADGKTEAWPESVNHDDNLVALQDAMFKVTDPFDPISMRDAS
jgi:hypothetical protein